MAKLIGTLMMIFVMSSIAWSQGVREAPTDLVSQIASYNFKNGARDIVKRCLKLCFPDSDISESDQPVLCPLVANLDGSTYPEVLALVGWDENNTTLVVFRRDGEQWNLIFVHPVSVFYNAPELKVMDNASAHKVFCVRQLYDRGTGVFKDGYEYFKLIDGKARKCFEMVNRADIYGWDLYLNQDIRTTVSFSSSIDDMLCVHFTYNFFPGPVFKSDAEWDAHPELSFVRGDENVYYEWDSTRCQYIQMYPPTASSLMPGLSDSQISCFGRFGDDSLFVSAFQKQLQDTLAHGTAEVRQLLKVYLQQVQLHGRAFAPSGPLEEKTQVGGTKFYGPKKKHK